MGSGAENGYEYEAPGVAVDAGELQKAREWLQPRFCGHPPEARGNYFGEVGRAGRAVCNRLGCHVTLEEVAMAYKAHRRQHGKKVKQEHAEWLPDAVRAGKAQRGVERRLLPGGRPPPHADGRRLARARHAGDARRVRAA